MLHHFKCAFKCKKLCWPQGRKQNKNRKGGGDKWTVYILKGEMFIREGIQPLLTTKKDYLWVSLQTINSQPVFHRQTSPSSSYWHYWYSHYSKNQISSSNHNRLPDTKKLLYTCPHLHKLFADLPHNLDHYFHFRRGLTQKNHKYQWSESL